MSNHLIHETSPYLLQHAENPVDWYPWGDEAFDRAKKEDKPVFLSIGYSTCHWCHVMAHESFEDQKIAAILNQHFVSIKVDKEQRPDIDSIYMAVCQAFTGSGGWPASIFMTADQKPFLAGTYFPKTSRYGRIGFQDLLLTVQDQWKNHREDILSTANAVTNALQSQQTQSSQADEKIVDTAIGFFKQSFDKEFGGFGSAPKFPSPHNLLFLMQQFRKKNDAKALEMAEKTLLQMYRGGIFDHIGYGFCRYSTDRIFLVPHFEKMLYDNALLISAYCKAFEITRNRFYLDVAEKIAFYVLNEMTGGSGGFYSAQDADSDGVEGKYYVFEPHEMITLLGEKNGRAFNERYDITEKGNFEGKSIPNLLQSEIKADAFETFLPALREYRRRRFELRTDDKILTSWNALMIAAFCALYRASKKPEYLEKAKKTQAFLESKLCDGTTLYVSLRNETRGEKGFLDDYAYYSFALLCLYEATLENAFLCRADEMIKKAAADFFDPENGGFYLGGKENESLFFRPKESYDGALPSGNSVMAYTLVRMNFYRPNETLNQILKKQLSFMSGQAEQYPAGFAMYLMALSDYFNPPKMITALLGNKQDLSELIFKAPTDSIIKVLETPTDEYKLIHDKTTYYVCQNQSCFPPVNDLASLPGFEDE